MCPQVPCIQARSVLQHKAEKLVPLREPSRYLNTAPRQIRQRGNGAELVPAELGMRNPTLVRAKLIGVGSLYSQSELPYSDLENERCERSLYGNPSLGYSQQFPIVIGANACPFSNWLYLLGVKMYRPPVTCGFSTATITGDQSSCCGWECGHGSRCLSASISVQVNDDLVAIFKVKDANDNDLFPQPMGSTVTIYFDDACAGTRQYSFTRTMQEAMVLTCDPQFIGYGAVRFTVDQPLFNAINALTGKKGYFGLEWHG